MLASAETVGPLSAGSVKLDGDDGVTESREHLGARPFVGQAVRRSGHAVTLRRVVDLLLKERVQSFVRRRIVPVEKLLFRSGTRIRGVGRVSALSQGFRARLLLFTETSETEVHSGKVVAHSRLFGPTAC